METMSEQDVKHDPLAKMFSITNENGEKVAFLQYEKTGKTFDLWHTEVPEKYRGQGLAGILAGKSIADLASADNSTHTVLLTCSYLQHFYSKNREKFKQFSNIKLPS